MRHYKKNTGKLEGNKRQLAATFTSRKRGLGRSDWVVVFQSFSAFPAERTCRIRCASKSFEPGSTMQVTRSLADILENKPQQKEIDGLSNAAAVQIFSGLGCIALQVKKNKKKNSVCRQHLRPTPFRYVFNRPSIYYALQVFLLVNYHDADESIQHNGNTIFTLAVGSFGLIAGIFGCFAKVSRKWFK